VPLFNNILIQNYCSVFLLTETSGKRECGQFSRLHFDKYINSSMIRAVTQWRHCQMKLCLCLISTFDQHFNAELLIFVSITSFQVRILETETLLRRNKELIRNGVTIVGEFIIL